MRRVRRVLRILLAAAVAWLVSAAPLRAEPPGRIAFTGSNLLVTAEGTFRDWRIVEARIDEEDPARSRVVVAIDVASLDTGIRARDEHLRSEAFFDVARHPTARAVVENVRELDATGFTADVTLEIRDREKTFPMRFEIVDRAARRIAGKTVLDRNEWGVGEPFSRWVPLSIRDEVDVRVEATVPETEPRAPR